MPKSINGLFRFVLAGLINSVIGYSVFLLSFYGLNLAGYISNILAYGLGLIVSLFQMRTWVFPSSENFFSYAVKFLGIFGVSYLLNLTVFVVIVSFTQIVPALAQLVAMAVYSSSFFLFSRTFLHQSES
jgi:putative flippase GtrA